MDREEIDVSRFMERIVDDPSIPAEKSGIVRLPRNIDCFECGGSGQRFELRFHRRMRKGRMLPETCDVCGGTGELMPSPGNMIMARKKANYIIEDHIDLEAKKRIQALIALVLDEVDLSHIKDVERRNMTRYNAMTDLAQKIRSYLKKV